jgi:hypothetical protein
MKDSDGSLASFECGFWVYFFDDDRLRNPLLFKESPDSAESGRSLVEGYQKRNIIFCIKRKKRNSVKECHAQRLNRRASLARRALFRSARAQAAVPHRANLREPVRRKATQARFALRQPKVRRALRDVLQAHLPDGPAEQDDLLAHK